MEKVNTILNPSQNCPEASSGLRNPASVGKGGEMRCKFFRAICYLLVILIPYTSFATCLETSSYQTMQQEDDSANLTAIIICVGLGAVILVWLIIEGAKAEAEKKEEISEEKLEYLELGMGKMRVRHEILGKPNAVRGSIKNMYGQVIEVWEYRLYPTYWLWFCDGRLVQWGRAGDWKQEADRIYEFRF